MYDMKKMFKQEISYCDLFTNKISTEYGKIYYNPLNPLSWDNNHAHILDINWNTEVMLQDIIQFYRSRKLVPRVYGSFIDNELEKLEPVLKSRGFTLDIFSSEFRIFPARATQTVERSISIRRVTQLSDDIIELIHTDELGDWSINVLSTSLKDSQIHLLGLFKVSKCLSIASVRILDEYSRIDDVKTHKLYRNVGFDKIMIDKPC
jgi:hypothetical protein